MTSGATPKFILTLSCPSGPGQVAAISAFLDGLGCYIEELSVFDDDLSQRFFVRCVAHTAADSPLSLQRARQEFAPVAERFSRWRGRFTMPPNVRAC